MRRRTKGRLKKFEEKYKEELPQQEEQIIVKTENHRKKNKNKSRYLLRAVLVVLAIVLFASVKNIFVLQAERKALKEQNETLLLEKESLENELKNASDEEYIEEQARIQLKLIKPGEILYILEDEKDNKSNEEDDKNKDEEKN